MSAQLLQDLMGAEFVIGRPLGLTAEGPGPISIFLWCDGCRRTFPNGWHRDEDGVMTCPYADCDAELAFHSHAWDPIPRRFPAYPVIPMLTVDYPLPPPLGRA